LFFKVAPFSNIATPVSAALPPKRVMILLSDRRFLLRFAGTNAAKYGLGS
jgi:hypothetical protein